MTKAELLARIDDAISKGHAMLNSVGPIPAVPAHFRPSDIPDPENRWVQPGPAVAFRIAGLAILQSLYGTDHQFYRDFEVGTHGKRTLFSLRSPVALIETVREQVDAGWLEDARALISADIFSNIIEMADYLLSESYKDAAAVLVGGSLEGHLRSLAIRHGVETQEPDRKTGRMKARRAEALNEDLPKKSVYNLADQKQVTAWLNIRNDAAHVKYENYTQAQVQLMLQGVRDFICRVPA